MNYRIQYNVEQSVQTIADIAIAIVISYFYPCKILQWF